MPRPNTGEVELWLHGRPAAFGSWLFPIRLPAALVRLLNFNRKVVTWVGCPPRRVQIVHRIVTHDTPRARDLTGKLVVAPLGGAATFFRVTHAGAPYAVGAAIPVVEHGHDGGGDHTWHEGVEQFEFTAIRPGAVMLVALVDPDPEVPEGDGPSTRPAIFRVLVPAVRSIEFADSNWNALDWKEVILLADPLRITIHIDEAISDVRDRPCSVQLRTTGIGAAADGTSPTWTSVAIDPSWCTLANGGTEIRVTIPMQTLWSARIVSANATGPGVVTADLRAGRGSNYNDGDLVDRNLRARGHLQRGKGRTIQGGVDGNATATPPESSVSMSFMKAAGVELIEARLSGVTSQKRQVQRPATVLYYSGHGYHTANVITTNVGRFGPQDAGAHWARGLQKIIIAGCSVLDIKDYNNNYPDPADHTASPGEAWFGLGLRTLLGYNWKGPLDDQGGNANYSSTIAANYFRYLRTSGLGEGASWCTANADASAGFTHDVALGRGYNACGIDSPPTGPEYWYHRDVGAALNPRYVLTRKTPPW